MGAVADGGNDPPCMVRDGEPGARPVCERLSFAMLAALRTGKTRSGVTAQALQARRLWCPGGVGEMRFATTPMGEQWRQTLLSMDRMRRALRQVESMLQGLKPGRWDRRDEALDAIRGGLLGE